MPSLRIAYQNQLTPAEFTEAMLLELEGLDEMRLQALNALQVSKARAARAYNKKVKSKSFEEGDPVWKVILPRVHDPIYGKWSPNWEGPFHLRLARSCLGVRTS